MPKQIILNIKKVTIFFLISFLSQKYCMAKDSVNVEQARTDLLNQAYVWLEQELKTSREKLEVLPPDHRVKILRCETLLVFDFPFNGKETMRARCKDPIWQFFLRVKTDDPDVKTLLSPIKRTQKKKPVTSEKTVLVAKTNLSAGAILKESDVNIVKIKRTGLPVDTYNSFKGLENHELISEVKASKIIRSINLRPAKLIKRGNSVVFNILARGMLVSATMEALEDGRMGDQIKLLNPSSGKTVVGTVIGVNEVSGL